MAGTYDIRYIRYQAPLANSYTTAYNVHSIAIPAEGDLFFFAPIVSEWQHALTVNEKQTCDAELSSSPHVLFLDDER